MAVRWSQNVIRNQRVITVVTVPRASVTPSEVFTYYCNEAGS